MCTSFLTKETLSVTLVSNIKNRKLKLDIKMCLAMCLTLKAWKKTSNHQKPESRSEGFVLELELQGLDLGFKAGIWALRPGYGPQGLDLGFKAGIWALRPGYERRI